MKKIAILFLISLFSLLLGCSNDSIKEIKFIYAEENTSMIQVVPCSEDFFGLLHNVLQTKICKEQSFINKFASLYEKLQPDTSCSFIDARIMAVISYKESSQKDTLCFGEYGGIDLNGNFMQDNNELLSIVKNEVWGIP